MAKKKAVRKSKSFSEAIGLQYIFDNTITDFFIGLALLLVAIACIIAMVSYINTGALDQSILENLREGDVANTKHDDLLQLHRRIDFTPGLYIEVQDLAESFGIEDKSLQKIYANLFHEKISKAQRLSNWEADILRDSQKVYAATDAWSCVMLYREFMRLKETQDYELVKIEDEHNIESEHTEE